MKIKLYQEKCLICSELLKRSRNVLSNHLHHWHKDISKQEYYDLYLKKDKEGLCVVCGKVTRFVNINKGYLETCCKSCDAKKQWLGEKGKARKAKLSNIMSENNYSIGRPIGSKNKNPYPEESRKLKSAMSKGRSNPWNRNEEKIQKQKNTWASKSEEDISIIVNKQIKTKIKNKTNNRFYQGRYKPKNPKKYINQKNLGNIIYRSSWELFLMKWCDNNQEVVSWGAEEVIIPYISKVDGKQHRYFLDAYIKFKSGQIYLVEVKPKYQTSEPKIEGKTKKRLLQEMTTYAVNISKWEAATAYAIKNNAKFVIWTEDELNKMGMKLNTSKSFRYAKYAKKKGKRNGAKRK